MGKQLDERYNQLTVNWYSSGENYIESHSDCCAKMVTDADILIINLSDDDSRELVFSSKRSGLSNSIRLSNGLYLIMSSASQQHWRHGVPANNSKNSRISLTFRMMR